MERIIGFITQPCEEGSSMKLHVVSDTGGRVVASAFVLEEGPIRAGFRARDGQYVHEVEVPPQLRHLELRDIARKLTINKIGDARSFLSRQSHDIRAVAGQPLKHRVARSQGLGGRALPRRRGGDDPRVPAKGALHAHHQRGVARKPRARRGDHPREPKLPPVGGVRGGGRRSGWGTAERHIGTDAG